MSKITYIVASFALIGVLAAFVGTFHAVSQRNLSQDNTVADLWSHWKLNYGKVYAAEEEAHRFLTFTNNYNFVMNWNADVTQTSSVGLNQFADMNTEEFSAMIGCLVPQPATTPASETVSTSVKDGELPASVDWRAKGAVTPVKNQGQCGSCWSFSTTGVLEGLNFINNGDLLSFSEQQLVDCSQKYGNQGCNGGWPFWALEYTAANGIELESTYPYTATDTKCTYNKANVKFQNQGYANVTTSGNQVDMATALVNQPISVCVEADQPVFQLYTGGVITSASCGTQLDHAIMAVGYSTEGSTPYWIVKNSWGSSWGLAGYLYIEKSSATSGSGVCGIGLNVAVPTKLSA